MAFDLGHTGGKAIFIFGIPFFVKRETMCRSVLLATGLSLSCVPAQARPAQELSDFIADVIPQVGFGQIDWGYMSDNTHITWTTNGIERGNVLAQRVGTMRLQVAGVVPKLLRQKWVEMRWRIGLKSQGNTRFGPQYISIETGDTAPETCFATDTKDCLFTAAQALASPRLKTTLLCTFHTGVEVKDAFTVVVDRKKSAMVVFYQSGGSGGINSWVEIRPPSDKGEICKPD